MKTEVNKIIKSGKINVEFYKACAYRWTENMANPDRDDEQYFTSEEEAIEYSENLKLEVGYCGIVEKIKAELNNFANFLDENNMIDLSDVNDHNRNSYIVNQEEIFNTGDFTGDSIEGAILVEWSYATFVGYARNLINIGIAGEWPFSDFKEESDLITGNEESTFRSNYSVLLTANEIKDLTKEELKEHIKDSLNEFNWKWNYFKNNPNSPFISERIEEIIN